MIAFCRLSSANTATPMIASQIQTVANQARTCPAMTAAATTSATTSTSPPA